MAKDAFETVSISSCKSCKEPFSVERPAQKTTTKDVQVMCPVCNKTHFYRKRTNIDGSTDINHLADVN